MDVDLVSESSFEENIQGHSSPPPPPLNSFTQTSPSLSQDSNCQITFLAGHFARYKGQPLPKPNSTVKQVWGSVPNLDRTSTTTVFRHELGTDVSIMEGMFQLIMRGPDHVTGMICNVVNGPQAPINSVPIFTQRLFSILSQSESENLRVCLRRGVMCLFSSHWNSVRLLLVIFSWPLNELPRTLVPPGVECRAQVPMLFKFHLMLLNLSRPCTIYLKS